MNFFSFSALLNAITSLVLGAFVFIKNKKDARNITFGLMCLSIFVWSAFYFLWQISTAEYPALIFTRGLMAGSIFIPIFYVHLIFVLFNIQKNKRKVLSMLYIYACLMLIADSTRYFIKSVSPKACFSFWPNPGILFHLFLSIWISVVCYGLFLTLKDYKQSRGIKRNQIKYFLLAALIGWSGGATNFFLWYNIPILPYGNILVSGFVILITYAIIRHQLLDIGIVIRKTAIYSILATVITIIYFIIVYIMEVAFRGFMGYKSIPWTLGVIVMFTLMFQPLKNLVQPFVDKYFFKRSQAVLSAELEKAQEELKRTERLKVVGTLAAGMAHEIKNPLTGIKTFTEYLPTKYNEPGFIDKFCKIVGAEVDKINSIVQQLLDFSKPRQLKLEQINIHTLIEQTLSFLNNDFIKNRIEVLKDFDSSLPLLNIDPNQIKQVFLNLFLNAIDAMKEDGKIAIVTKPVAGYVEIIIEDTGKGMAKKDLEHIFDPFYTTKETGTGLGMSIVYGIIKEHKGEISVKSEENKGTAFTIRLPIA
ncbi:MAG: ATP-binding protein [Candidatus Omnitrophica bacterium]|nr:ATP-binding protein [Candidatus Omnitrophota bacterium]